MLLYRQLLASQGCEDALELDDALYRQGAIQLALGLLIDEFLPEVIGYNLGYEQMCIRDSPSTASMTRGLSKLRSGWCE